MSGRSINDMTPEEIGAHFGLEARQVAEIRREREQVQRVKALIEELADNVDMCAHWGDGYGGWIKQLIREAMERRGYEWEEPAYSTVRKKKVIGRGLAKKVMERDAYRCVTCGSHEDLTCDHIHPESKGGETSLDNLQTMCRSCNSKKGARA